MPKSTPKIPNTPQVYHTPTTPHFPFVTPCRGAKSNSYQDKADCIPSNQGIPSPKRWSRDNYKVTIHNKNDYTHLESLCTERPTINTIQPNSVRVPIFSFTPENRENLEQSNLGLNCIQDHAQHETQSHINQTNSDNPKYLRRTIENPESGGVNQIKPNTEFKLNYQKQMTNVYQPSIPSFGQAMFPKYLLNDTVSNIVWTPIQIPAMYVPNSQNVERKIDKTTQTMQYESVVHTCGQHLSNQFSKYVSGREKNTELNIADNTSKFTQTAFEKDHSNENLFNNFESDTINAVLIEVKSKRNRSVSESDKTVECAMKSNFSKSENVDDEVENSKDIATLESNDLRFLILARKRRKSVDLGDLHSYKGIKFCLSLITSLVKLELN
jgi:hypothetical protein